METLERACDACAMPRHEKSPDGRRTRRPINACFEPSRHCCRRWASSLSASRTTNTKPVKLQSDAAIWPKLRLPQKANGTQTRHSLVIRYRKIYKRHRPQNRPSLSTTISSTHRSISTSACHIVDDDCPPASPIHPRKALLSRKGSSGQQDKHACHRWNSKSLLPARDFRRPPHPFLVVWRTLCLGTHQGLWQNHPSLSCRECR